MNIRLNRIEDFRDVAVRVDEECYSASHLPLFIIDPIFLSDLPVQICGQGKGKFVLLGKHLMRVNIIHADAEHFSTSRSDLLVYISEPTPLDRASRRVIFRVEVQHYPFSPEVTEV